MNPPLTDPELWAAFQSRTLPGDRWTHEAHLRTAWMHLKRHPIDDAHILIRVGIILLNASHGLTETPQRGYHETVTRAYLAIIAGLMRTDDSPDSLAFVTRHADQLKKGATLRHYTQALITSPHARAAFVPPDVEPLPQDARPEEAPRRTPG